MKTQVYDANDENSISKCAELIRSGQLVAFPTETVYGLGADGLNSCAVDSIFAAKGRPNDNPLILHIADADDAKRLFSSVPDMFHILAKAFMPGPLTVIYNKSDIIPHSVTAGLNTVAVRMPDNVYALSLIQKCGVPIAAPSANISGRPSPTSAEHVIHDLNGKIPAVLDGGECRVGLESTVISIAGVPTILRPGAITREMLEAVLGCEVAVSVNVLNPPAPDMKPQSPGMKYCHYAPNADAYAVFGNEESIPRKIIQNFDSMSSQGKNVCILGSVENAPLYGSRSLIVLGKRSNPSSFCAALFSALRRCDDYDVILCETLSPAGLGLAYMNRLMRACGFKTIE